MTNSDLYKISFILFCALFTSTWAIKLSAEEHDLRPFIFSDLKFEQINSGGFSVVYTWLKNRKMVFKHINLNEVCKKYIGNLAKYNLCRDKYSVEINREISINEYLQTVFAISKGFNFDRYFAKYNGYISGPPYQAALVMERLDQDLIDSDILMHLRKASLTRRLLTYMNIIRAIFVLHALGINHCDIKLENFILKEPILSEDDLPGEIVIVDFGKANRNKFCGIGTEGYADPMISAKLVNQEPDDVNETRHADIYSAGMVLLSLETCIFTEPVENIYEYLGVFTGLVANELKNSKKKKVYAKLLELFKDMLHEENRQTNMLQIMAQLEMLIVESAKIENESLTNFEHSAAWLSKLKKAIPSKFLNVNNFPVVTLDLAKFFGQKHHEPEFVIEDNETLIQRSRFAGKPHNVLPGARWPKDNAAELGSKINEPRNFPIGELKKPEFQPKNFINRVIPSSVHYKPANHQPETALKDLKEPDIKLINRKGVGNLKIHQMPKNGQLAQILNQKITEQSNLRNQQPRSIKDLKEPEIELLNYKRAESIEIDQTPKHKQSSKFLNQQITEQSNLRNQQSELKSTSKHIQQEKNIGADNKKPPVSRVPTFIKLIHQRKEEEQKTREEIKKRLNEFEEVINRRVGGIRRNAREVMKSPFPEDLVARNKSPALYFNPSPSIPVDESEFSKIKRNPIANSELFNLLKQKI